MAAPTEVYIDPSIAGDSGTGTIGDPYGDLQYALDQVTRDSTNGDRFNVKAGTDEVLAAALDLSTYGTPTSTAPLILQGYTSSAGDGGKGGISGAGSYGMWAASALDFIYMIDLHMHNSGAAAVVDLDNFCAVINCEVDNTSGAGVTLDTGGLIWNCHIHNCGGNGAEVHSGTIAFNTLENGTNDFSNAIAFVNGVGSVIGNVIDIDGSSNGIYSFARSPVLIANNSIYSNGGTGNGIYCIDTAYGASIIVNNMVEGFSGVSGVGIELLAGDYLSILGFNAYYNNATNLTKSGDVLLDLTSGDQALDTTSPFTNAGSDDFTVDTRVKALAYPTANYPSLAVRSYLDIGALQREEPAGGSGGRRSHIQPHGV